MKNHFDVGIVGLGVMGLSTALQCRSRHFSVIGFDQFDCAHDKGSSHGASRIIRKAYFEHPNYVPLLQRSYLGWQSFETLCNKKFFHDVGLVIYGQSGNSPILNGIRRSAEKYHLRVNHLDYRAATKKYKTFTPPDSSWEAIEEPDAGYLLVEPALSSIWQTASKLGAELKANNPILGYQRLGNGHQITTETGTYVVKKLVVSAGAWTNHFLEHLDWQLPISLHRTVLSWYKEKPSSELPLDIPAFGFDLPEGFVYGFPSLDEKGIKIAHHSPGTKLVSPESIDRSITPSDSAIVDSTVEKWIPNLTPKAHESSTCIYSMTPDENFILDFHPKDKSIIAMSGFSGHGFKFAPVIGEIAASMLLTESYDPATSFLKADRFC